MWFTGSAQIISVLLLAAREGGEEAITNERLHAADNLLRVVMHRHRGRVRVSQRRREEKNHRQTQHGGEQWHATHDDTLTRQHEQRGDGAQHVGGVLDDLHGDVDGVSCGDDHEKQNQREGRHHVRGDRPVLLRGVVAEQIVGNLPMRRLDQTHLLHHRVEGGVAPVEELVALADNGVENRSHVENVRRVVEVEREKGAEEEADDDGGPEDALGTVFHEELRQKR